MLEQEVTIQNKLGLHLRAAAVFIETANKFPCQVFLRKAGQEKVNAKSIMGIMALGAACGSAVTVVTDGENESEALEKLTALIQNRFGEKE